MKCKVINNIGIEGIASNGDEFKCRYNKDSLDKVDIFWEGHWVVGIGRDNVELFVEWAWNNR